MKKNFVTICLIIGIATFSSLGAADLNEIVEQAKANSVTVKTLQLNKKQTELTLGLNDIEEKIALSFDGTLLYDKVKFAGLPEFAATITPALSLVFPNDGKTNITFQVGPITKSFESTAFSASPTIKASHTFTLGSRQKTQDDLDDLKLTRQRLELDFKYAKGLITFENSVYQKIIELLGYEKSIFNLEDQIAKQKQKMENALALRTMTEESSSYKSMILALNKSESSLESTRRQLELAHKQYTQVTGLVWDGLDAVPDSDLTFLLLPTGDTSVVLSSLDVEIASLELLLEEQKRGAKTIGLNGSVGIANANNVTPNTVGYSFNAGSTLSASNFSLGVSVDIDFSNDFKATPSFTISGSWKNDTASESDYIKLQQLSNAVELAVINQQEALQSYLESADALQSELLNHQISSLQRADDARYNQQLLDQAIERLNRGLGTQDDVDGAHFTIELASYDQQIFQLEALLLANKIKVLRY